MNTRFNFLLLLVVTIVVLVSYQISIVRTSTTSRGEPPVIGWIDGNCFAVAKNDVQSESYIFVVSLGGSQNISEAKILGPAVPQKCAPLAAERRAQNLAAGLSFYEIQARDTIEKGIGVLGKIGRRKIKNDLVHADIDGDRKAEQYSMCTTSEGFRFNVWSSKPYTQEPKWSGFYYIGHGLERTCP